MSPVSGQGTPAPVKLDVTITSLDMVDRPARASVPLPPETRIARAERPSVAFYRFLYDTVGEPWLWADRRRWTDDRLLATIQDPAVEVWVLWVRGEAAGYAEIDRREAGAVELAYFGLMPKFIGQGLGPGLLSFAIDRAWESEPRRVWVHTCSFDHPSALGLYERAGFAVFRAEECQVDDPRSEGLIPKTAAPHIGSLIVP